MVVSGKSLQLIDDCVGGSRRRCDEILELYRATEPKSPERDDILDELARAGASSTAAADLLVRIIYEDRFVRAELRKVLINDDGAAEEALQETALGMVRGLPSFRGESTFRTWVTSIARNQAVGVLRRRRPTAELQDDDGEVARYSSMLADRTDVGRALEQLPEEFREAVRLRDIEHKSYEEIADLLDIPLNTVRSRLARGRSRLAAMFETGA